MDLYEKNREALKKFKKWLRKRQEEETFKKEYLDMEFEEDMSEIEYEEELENIVKKS